MLSRENYDTWKIQAEALLIKNDTWGYVAGEIQAPNLGGLEGNQLAEAEAAHKAWSMADRKAKADLILSIQPSELKQVQNCTTSNEVWKKLETIYASKGPARKVSLLKRLTRHTMQEGDNLRDHIAGFFDAADKLQKMDIEINQELLAMMLLDSLPGSYDNFRCAIESRDRLPDLDTLKYKIVEEYDARMKKKSGDNSNAAMFVKTTKQFQKKPTDGSTHKSSPAEDAQARKRSKSKMKCYFCGKPNHKESECRFKKKLTEQSANNAEEANCCYYTPKKTSKSRDDNNLWCIDSGCTSHLCFDENAFTRAEEACSDLKLADNSVTQVKAKGDVRFETAGQTVTLKNTLYVPELRTNLISVSKIVDNDHQVTFSKDRAVVRDATGKIAITAHRSGDLFYVRGT